MRDEEKSEEQLIAELRGLKRRVSELEAAAQDSEHIRVSGIDMRWDPGRGLCTFEGLPVAMMWIDTTLAGLMSGVQSMVGTRRFELSLQSQGRRSVDADWEVISGFPDFREGFKAIANIAAVAGWGEWEIVAIEREKKEVRFRVRNSWEGRYQKALGVCWGSGMLAGKMAGYCSKLFGTNCWAEQVAFIAKGDEFEEFVVRPSERLVEVEVENLLATDEATRADMAVALNKLHAEIEERKHAEEALRFTQFAIDHSADAAFWMGPDARFIYVNEAASKALGYTQKELLTMSVHDIDPNFPEEVWPDHWEELRERGSFTMESHHRAKSGELFPVEVTVNFMEFEGKEYNCAFARDTTERMRAQDALRESESTLKSIFRAAPTGIGMVVDRVIMRANDRLCEMTGYPRDELVGKGARMLYPSDEDYEYVGREKYAKIAETGTGTVETRWQRKDGEIIDVILSSTPLDASELSAGVTFTALDITARKRAEDALRRSEAKYRELYEGLREGVAAVDMEGRITEFNLVFRNMLGYKEEEIYPLTYKDITPEKWRPIEAKIIEEQVFTRGYSEVYEKEYRRKDGTVFPVELTTYLIRDDRGEPAGMWATIRDITKRKLAETELSRYQEHLEELVAERTAQLEATNKELEAFSYSVSHDLRAPLRAIDGFSQALMEDHHESLNEEGKGYLARVRAASQRMDRLINDLLSLSRVSRQKLEREDVDLSRLAHKVTTVLAEKEPERKVEISIEEGLVGRGDPFLLRIVLENLLGNAWKFTSRQPEAKIEFGSTLHEGKRAFFVSDNGAGFNMDYAQNLFRAFKRLHKPEEFEGAGIGLATVRRIIHRHEGRVCAEGEVGKGATFYFTLKD